MSGVTRIRVLIVDDVPEARDNVQKLLQFADEIQVVGQASSGREAIDLARKIRPDVILMDVVMPEMDGITATQTITAQIPGIAVVMSSVQSDTETLRRSLQAGARDYLFKPYGLDELTTAMRNAYQWIQTSRAQISAATAALTGAMGIGGDDSPRAKIITVFSAKGGVGRSVLAANLAVATKLATDKRVLLIDGNLPNGDIAVMVNATSSKTILELAVNLSHLDPDFVGDVLVNHSSGVKVLLAPTSPQDSEGISGDQVRTILTQLAPMFDYIFVDTRPSFEETQLAMLDQSDKILLVITPEITAVKAAKQYLEVAELLGYPNDRLSLVLNRVNNQSQIMVEDIEATLKGEVKARIPDDPTLVLRSVNEGVPIALSNPESKFARAVNQLAHLATDGDVPAEEDREQRRSGITGLFRRGNSSQRAQRPLVANAEG